MDTDFWKHKKLSEFTEEEWEAICLRCGKCCLFKDTINNVVFFSNQMCQHFDFKTGKCSCYKTRLNDFCYKVDMHLLQTEPELLPDSCAYKLLFTGKELPDYHPLVSGKPQSVHKAKKTVLEMPEVYSINELFKAAKRAQKMSADKAAELFKRYPLIYIEETHIPSAPHT